MKNTSYAEWDKVWSWLSSHLQPFFWLIACILTIFDKKYLILTRRNKESLNQNFCNKTILMYPKNVSLSDSLWLRLTLCLSLVCEQIFLSLFCFVSHSLQIVAVFELISLSLTHFLSLSSFHCRGFWANLFPIVTFLSQSPSHCRGFWALLDSLWLTMALSDKGFKVVLWFGESVINWENLLSVGRILPQSVFAT